MNKLLYLCLLLGFKIYAQHSEIGIFGGASYYIGELNPSVPVANQIRPALGIFYRKNLNNRYALRFGGNYGRIAAKDQFNSTALSEFRDLSFFTDIIDLYGVIEFNFLPYQINHNATPNFSPYVFIGAAIFRVNPQISNANGDRLPSTGASIAPAMPFGLGFKFDLSKNLGWSVEWSLRKTLTDEIDGLAPIDVNTGYQLSNSQNNDWYSFVGITLNYKFLMDVDLCPEAIN